MAVAIVGCTRGPRRGPVEITEAIQIDPHTLGLQLPSCRGEPEITILEESATDIHVEVVSTVHSNGDACADVIETTLERPLGDRDVIDLTSGDSLRITVYDS